MDDADITQERMEKEMTLRLTVRKPAPVATGQCHNCDEDLDGRTALFCPGGECRDDWEKRQKNRP